MPWAAAVAMSKSLAACALGPSFGGGLLLQADGWSCGLCLDSCSGERAGDGVAGTEGAGDCRAAAFDGEAKRPAPKLDSRAPWRAPLPGLAELRRPMPPCLWRWGVPEASPPLPAARAFCTSAAEDADLNAGGLPTGSGKAVMPRKIDDSSGVTSAAAEVTTEAPNEAEAEEFAELAYFSSKAWICFRLGRHSFPDDPEGPVAPSFLVLCLAVLGLGGGADGAGGDDAPWPAKVGPPPSWPSGAMGTQSGKPTEASLVSGRLQSTQSHRRHWPHNSKEQPTPNRRTLHRMSVSSSPFPSL
mmetsp:Transcript_144088/g.461255  ORF Transcript_144088/g.461255 Transcript_144088/m.461255 type:complete len:300 (+) Transcript_144088:2415-3314(+)